MLKRTPRLGPPFLSQSSWSPDGRRRRRRAVLWIGAGAVFAVALLLLSGRRDAAVSGASPAPAPARIMDFSVGAYAFGPDAAAGSSAVSPAARTPSSVQSPSSVQTPSSLPPPMPPDLDELTGFYMADAERYYSGCGYSSNRYEYTDQELYMLAQLISGEARGESSRGKIAVGNVVMNRVLSPGYPGDTIREVILSPGQFTGYSSSITPGAACMAAARQVLEKEVWVIPQDVYFFHAGAGRHWG
ncbi:MAG TPA: cell wall hydrolase, partial [Anaerovoracaceae bacterium]|nr:cell wall hydrolase [Anaerovoracaceae bacterium]